MNDNDFRLQPVELHLRELQLYEKECHDINISSHSKQFS